jgi:hypothetical protein
MRWGPLFVLVVLGACALDETPLPGLPVAGDGGDERDAAPDGGDADAGDAGDGGGGGTGCEVAVSAPVEVTLGTRVNAQSGLVCDDDPAGHACSWRAAWNDGNDEVETLTSGEHPCATGETFGFAAAAVSDDGSSFYRVTLSVDGDVAGTARVFVGRFLVVAGTKQGLGKVFDIAIDRESRHAWIASAEGLAAMLRFAAPDEEVLQSSANECADAVERCSQRSVAVAGGFAWAGSGADLDEIVQAEIVDRALEARAIGLAQKGPIRSIVASRADGGDSDPALYITNEDLTWFVARDQLDDLGLTVDDEVSTNGEDLAAIVAIEVEPSEDRAGEALWRLETGAGGTLQRLSTAGDEPVTLLPEDILDHNGSALALFQGLVVAGQSNGRAFAVDLESLDPEGDTPLVDASAILELPIVDDADDRQGTLDDVLDLHVSEDGLTLWAVAPGTLYRVTSGTLFASSVADLPADMRAIAVLTDEAGAEVILVGTDDGIYISRADLHD